VKDMKWYHYIGLIMVFLLTISSFTQIENHFPIEEHPKQSNSTDFFITNTSPSYGTQTTIEFYAIKQSVPNLGLGENSIKQTSGSELFNVDGFFSISIFKEISLIALGGFIAGLSKTVYSSKLQREWTKNSDLIKQTIVLNPGISLRGISRSTGLAMGSTQYWIRLLEQNNEINSLKLGKSNHYFECDQKLTEDAKLLYSLIQNHRIKNILNLLIQYPEISTQKEICNHLGYSKSLLSYYIKILRNYSILDPQMKNLSLSNDFMAYISNLDQN
jgi:predicted transcriptional regulator